MSERNQNDHDLPDPERLRPLNPTDEDRQHHFEKLIRISAVGISLYSLLHKLGVPAFLKFTTVSRSAYAEIDPSWVLVVLFMASFFVKGRWRNMALSAGSGAAFALGIFDSYKLLNGEAEGWLMVSKVLSSLPLALIGLIVLVKGELGKNSLKWGAVTAPCVLLALTAESLLKAPPSVIPQSQVASSELDYAFAYQESPECGATEVFFDVQKSARVIPTSLEISLKDCGFQPARILKNSNHRSLVFRNELKRSVNVHFWLFYDQARVRRSKNFIVPAGENSKEVAMENLADVEQILIVSDTSQELGMVLVVDLEKTRNLRIQAQSRPPRLSIYESQE